MIPHFVFALFCCLPLLALHSFCLSLCLVSLCSFCPFFSYVYYGVEEGGPRMEGSTDRALKIGAQTDEVNGRTDRGGTQGGGMDRTDDG